jgi:antitoxin (DNA-binding transcriptional repressor) of toxin-antitoxin stability system
MKAYTVNISEFRKRLSFYVREVKRGCKVIICHRNVPFAKMVRLSEKDDSDMN